MRKFLFSAVLIGSACVGANAANLLEGGDAARGQALVDKSCTTCHTQVFGDAAKVYTRSNRRVSSVEVLIDQTKLWNSSAGTRWADAQIIDAATYLNSTYYQFK